MTNFLLKVVDISLAFRFMSKKVSHRLAGAQWRTKKDCWKYFSADLQICKTCSLNYKRILKMTGSPDTSRLTVSGLTHRDESFISAHRFWLKHESFSWKSFELSFMKKVNADFKISNFWLQSQLAWLGPWCVDYQVVQLICLMLPKVLPLITFSSLVYKSDSLKN